MAGKGGSVDVDGGSSAGAGGGGEGRGGRRWSIIVYSMIFLPILEGTFFDADNPLLARYHEASDCAKGAHCGMSALMIPR